MRGQVQKKRKPDPFTVRMNFGRNAMLRGILWTGCFSLIWFFVPDTILSRHPARIH